MNYWVLKPDHLFQNHFIISCHWISVPPLHFCKWTLGTALISMLLGALQLIILKGWDNICYCRALDSKLLLKFRNSEGLLFYIFIIQNGVTFLALFYRFLMSPCPNKFSYINHFFDSIAFSHWLFPYNNFLYFSNMRRHSKSVQHNTV